VSKRSFGARKSLLVRTKKQIAERLAPEEGQGAPALMLGAIVNEMTTLTEGDEVSEPVVRRDVIAVSCRQNDPGGAESLHQDRGWTS
jgi:hypothetical protein